MLIIFPLIQHGAVIYCCVLDLWTGEFILTVHGWFGVGVVAGHLGSL